MGMHWLFSQCVLTVVTYRTDSVQHRAFGGAPVPQATSPQSSPSPAMR